MRIIQVRNSVPINPNFEIVRPYGPTEYIFLHFHEPIELFYRNSKIITRPHACLIYAPGTPQWFRNSLSNQVVIHDWMHIMGDVAEKLAEYGLKPDTLYYPSDITFAAKQIQKLEHEFFSGNKYREKMIDLEIEKLFLLLSRYCQQSDGLTIEPDLKQRVRSFRVTLFSSIEKDWTVKEMADSVYLSESRFFAVYKSIFGISPNKDLILARIERAKQLLMTKQNTVGQISVMTGYKNECHFVRQFKAQTGFTPSEFRKNELNKIF